MLAKKISFSKLKKISIDNEGIVLLGCGGNLNEWVDGVNKLLMEKKIIQENFNEIYLTVSTGGRQDITMLFHEGQKTDGGRMAIWRLQYGDCSWLSDFIVNYRKHYE